MVWAIWLIGLFYLFTLVLGYGAAALVGAETIKTAPGGVNSAAPLLAFHLGGPLLLGFISAVAFATILAVVAGLTITAAASFAHDIYANVIAKGKADADTEVKVARRTVVVIGILAIIGGIFANGQNVAFLVALAFAVAASANLPTIIYSLFWQPVHHPGRNLEHVRRPGVGDHPDCPLAGGFRNEDLDDPDGELRGLPAQQPGHRLHSARVPARLAGHRTGQEAEDTTKQAEMEVRSLTGIGAEKAVDH